MTCCSRRAPSVGSRTPRTTLSSRASRTGPDSNQHSTRPTRPPTHPPPRRDFIRERAHAADADLAPSRPVVLVLAPGDRLGWPHDPAKLSIPGLFKTAISVRRRKRRFEAPSAPLLNPLSWPHDPANGWPHDPANRQRRLQDHVDRSGEQDQDLIAPRVHLPMAGAPCHPGGTQQATLVK